MSTQLIPADALQAAYGSELILFAEGKVSKGTYDIHFERVSWYGGLKFRLVGRQLFGPFGEREYKYHQSFPIILLSRVYPSQSVIIVTANDPNGKEVPIKWLGGADPPSVQSEGDAKQHEGDQEIIKPGDTRYVILGGKLEVTERIPDSEKGYLNLEFDKQYLQLVSANIDEGKITWTFKATQLGKTPIVISGGVHGIPSAWLAQINVFIFKFTLPQPPDDSDASQTTTNIPAIYYDFKEKILKAQDIVRKTYPDAALKVVDASTPFSISETVYQLTALKATFTSATTRNTITIQNDGTALNNWPYPPQVERGILIGVADIDIKKLKVSLEDAGQILEKHGETAYYNMVLSEPVPAIPEGEPRYAFELVGRRFCYVGAMTGEYTPGWPVGVLEQEEKAKA